MICYFCGSKTEEKRLRGYKYFRCPNHKQRVLNWDDSNKDYFDPPSDNFVIVDIEENSKWIRFLWEFDVCRFSAFRLDNPDIIIYELDYLPNYKPEEIPDLYKRLMKLKAFL